MSDSCLICFFSWGRKDMVKRSFSSLLQAMRPQDKLLVFDQKGHNIKYYYYMLENIDYLITTRLNYEIGPAWMLFQDMARWILRTALLYPKDKEDRVKRTNELFRGWKPDYICIVESDCIGREGWIDRVLKIFESKEPIGIASGYDAPEWPAIRMDGDIKIKEINPGVNMVFKTDYFLNLFDTLWYKGQDRRVSELNKAQGKVIGVINEILHIGEGTGRIGGFRK